MSLITAALLYTSYAFMFALATISLAAGMCACWWRLLLIWIARAGLFYIAELVEEHTVLTKKIIKYTIFVS